MSGEQLKQIFGVLFFAVIVFGYMFKFPIFVNSQNIYVNNNALSAEQMQNL